LQKVKKTRREGQAAAPGGVLEHFELLATWHTSQARDRRIAARVIAICDKASKARAKRRIMEND
jgi:trehalose-6-phosphatase